MDLLGRLSHIAKSGNLVLRSKRIPSIYSFVVDKNSTRIGQIRDVIGPASKPYILVKPQKKFTEKEIAALDFYEIQKRRK